jgi:hypothetical protein
MFNKPLMARIDFSSVSARRGSTKQKHKQKAISKTSRSCITNKSIFRFERTVNRNKSTIRVACVRHACMARDKAQFVVIHVLWFFIWLFITHVACQDIYFKRSQNEGQGIPVRIRQNKREHSFLLTWCAHAPDECPVGRLGHGSGCMKGGVSIWIWLTCELRINFQRKLKKGLIQIINESKRPMSWTRRMDCVAIHSIIDLLHVPGDTHLLSVELAWLRTDDSQRDSCLGSLPSPIKG